MTFKNRRQMWMFMLPVGDGMPFSGAQQQRPRGTDSCHVLHFSLLSLTAISPRRASGTSFNSCQLIFFTYIYIYNTTLHQVSLTILISGWKFTTSVRDREKFRAQNASNSQLNNKKYISTAMVSFTLPFLALFPPALFLIFLAVLQLVWSWRGWRQKSLTWSSVFESCGSQTTEA